MATKRMFSNNVIDSDLFLDLSPMAQLLYFHCGMKTDDDGFVAGGRRIAKIIGATEHEFFELTKAGFLIEFPESKVFCIVHHNLNNDLKKDRYHPTNFQQEFAQLEATKNKEWKRKHNGYEMDTDRIQNDSEPDTELNVAQPNVAQKSGGKGSDEGETDNSIMLLRCMAQQAGITADVERALSEYGFSVAHNAMTAWKENGSAKGKYKEYLKGDSK